MKKTLNARHYAFAKKLLLKIMGFFLVIMMNVFQMQGGNSQKDMRVSVSMHDVYVKTVLDEIEKQTGLTFLYLTKEINVQRKVTIRFKSVPLDVVLEELFKESKVTFIKRGNQVVLKRAEDLDKLEKRSLGPQEWEVPVAQQGLSLVNNFRHTFLNTKLAPVKGKVKDEKGEPIPGVTIIVKGTSLGTTTDAEGSFSIEITEPSGILIFSSIGYLTQEVAIGGRSQLNIQMALDVKALSEVVVVGYGTQKKETLTGAVATVKGDMLKKSPATNMTNNLVGRLPGLVAVNRSGEPGYDGSTLRIRGMNTLGDNDPLVVIDGIANREGGFSRINPNDIESITILKDASAAIYGAQAANGVILVTTKRGKSGKPLVSFNYNQGFNQPSRLPQMTDAATYSTMLNEVDLYRGRTPRYTEEDIQKYRDGSDPWKYPNTDWYAETLKPMSLQKSGNLSLTGGSDNVKYYVSLGGNGEDGYYKNSATKYSQYNLRSNIDGKVNKYISLGFDISGRQENLNFPVRSAGSIFRALMRGKPNLPAYWPNGMPGPDIEYGDNPAVTSTDATGYDKDRRYIIQSNLKLNVTIPWVKGLSFTANGAFDKFFRFRKRFEKPWYLYSWDYKTYDADNNPVLVRGKRGFEDSRLLEETTDGQNVTVNAVLNYDKNFGSHHLGLMVGSERQQIKSDFLNAYRRFFISDAVDQIFAGGDAEKNNGGGAFQSARLNYFGRVNYSFKEKYLLDFVWRYDGSFIFPQGKRFGFFPGISAGWRVSEEEFWKTNLSEINSLKIRGSWGQTGNDRIDPYQFLTTFGFGGGYVLGLTNEAKSLYVTKTPNPDVTWEIANQSNIGLEAQLLNGRIGFEFDYFYNLRTNILWNRSASLPGTSGITPPRENIGKFVNQGVDLLLSYKGEAGPFTYDVAVNGSYAKNEIKFWDEAAGALEWQKATGHPVMNPPTDNGLYYKSIGVFKDQEEVDSYPHWANARPGDVRFEDYNKDGQINGDDRIRMDRNNIPRLTGGFSVNLGYKQFDVSILFQGAAGAVQYVFTESGEIGNYLQEFADKRWTPENPNSSHPRTFNRGDEYWVAQRNTYWLKKSDYLRLKNIELGYSLPNSIKEKLGIQNLRIYINGFNLLTIDKLKAFDPEADNQSGQYYPQKRIINAGLALTF